MTVQKNSICTTFMHAGEFDPSIRNDFVAIFRWKGTFANGRILAGSKIDCVNLASSD